MTPATRQLLREAERSLTALAPARPATRAVRVDGEVMFVAACLACSETIRSGRHHASCRWYRARTTIERIRRTLRAAAAEAETP